VIDSVAAAGEKLRALAGARSPADAFLSVTLSTSRLDDWRQFAPAFLRTEFNRVTRDQGTPKDKKRVLQSCLDYVLDVLKYEVTPTTQGLAVFADAGTDFRERIELPLRLVNRLVVEPFPHIRPVAHALALLEPFVIARVSRDESSLYLVDEWGVASAGDLAGPWLRSSYRETGEVSIKEYYAAARQDTLVELHFKEVAASLGKLLETSGTRRVVLSAQHDIAVGFRRALTGAVASKVVAQIPWDAAASIAQMAVSAREAQGRARHQEMTALAARVKEGLNPGGHGVCGFDDVFAALGRRQVQILLVDRNYRVAGHQCTTCGWVGLTAVDVCPACAGAIVPLADAVGELVRLAILQGGQVEVGEDIPVLDELGGVAGLLRYA